MGKSTAIKTKVIGGDLAGTIVLTTTIANELILDWQPQEDIRVVAAEVVLRHWVRDAHVNADGEALCYAELTRAGAFQRDGSLLVVRLMNVWTAAISVGGPGVIHEVLTYPAGFGVDIDDGASLNLIMGGLWTGAGGATNLFARAIVHYVER